MSDISFELAKELSARAEVHYPDVLPYHNWDHALDMMDTIKVIADNSIHPEIRAKRNLLVVTAAWHDADYAIEDLGEYESKEERSAYLAVRSLPELSDEDAKLLFDGIIDTTVAKTPKSNIFGEVVHAADVGYFAASRDHFMGRLVLMREEWGSPEWELTIERTILFGRTVINEAKHVMPKVLPGADAADWISRIEDNLEYIGTGLDLRTLK